MRGVTRRRRHGRPVGNSGAVRLNNRWRDGGSTPPALSRRSTSAASCRRSARSCS